jgi:DNA-binding PadR family transcriptional regulator
MFHRPFFPFERHARIFEKGDLKYVILSLLKAKPSHGYEIIRALEDYFHGFYTPSAGSVYPTLQMLDDMGYVSASERDGKKVYTITDEGLKFLEEQQDVIKNQGADGRLVAPARPRDFHDTVKEMRNLGRLVGPQSPRLSSEQWGRIREVVTRACRDIEEIVGKD